MLTLALVARLPGGILCSRYAYPEKCLWEIAKLLNIATIILMLSAIPSRHVKAFWILRCTNFYQKDWRSRLQHALLNVSLMCCYNTDLQSSLSLYISNPRLARCTSNFLTSPDEAPEFRTENLWTIKPFANAASSSSPFGIYHSGLPSLLLFVYQFFW